MSIVGNFPILLWYTHVTEHFLSNFFHRFRHALASLVSEVEHVTKTTERQPLLVNVYLTGRENCVK